MDDINEAAGRVKDKGSPFSQEVSKGKDNNYQFWIRDPDGNWLEFMEMQPDSPQMRS